MRPHFFSIFNQDKTYFDGVLIGECLLLIFVLGVSPKRRAIL